MKYVILSVNWSNKVKTKWTPPKGLFTKSATQIAKVLHNQSSDLKQAMSRLVFYINRAGSNLGKNDVRRLTLAKIKLRNLFKEP